MSPLLPALALTASWVVIFWSYRLLRDPGPLAALQAAPVVEEERSRRARRGPVTAVTQWLGRRLAPRAARLLSERQVLKIRSRLDSAGKPDSMTVEEYAGRKAALALMLGGAASPLLLDRNVIVPSMLGGLGWFLMDIWLSSVSRERQDEIERQLPDFLDVLAVTVGAGVAFRTAMERVAEALGGALAEEMMTCLHQMELGESRRDAFLALRDRNNSESLGKFVTTLLQAEKLGRPWAKALSSLANDMRSSSYQEARRRAQRAAPRVSLYVSTLIVPGAVILIAAAILIGSDFNVGEVFGS